MKPPINAELIEWPSSKAWFDEYGIFCSYTVKDAQLTLEEAKQMVCNFKNSLNGNKVCFLIDFTNSRESTKEIRDFISEEFPEMTKALAMTASTPLGRMMGNLLFTIKKQPFPVKMFQNETQAKEWLKVYL